MNHLRLVHSCDEEEKENEMIEDTTTITPKELLPIIENAGAGRVLMRLEGNNKITRVRNMNLKQKWRCDTCEKTVSGDYVAVRKNTNISVRWCMECAAIKIHLYVFRKEGRLCL